MWPEAAAFSHRRRIACIEELDVRDVLDVVTIAQVGNVVDIDLQKSNFAGEVFCRLLENRSETVTWTAPIRLEIDDDWRAALLDQVIKLTGTRDLDHGTLSLSLRRVHNLRVDVGIEEERCGTKRDKRTKCQSGEEVFSHFGSAFC